MMRRDARVWKILSMFLGLLPAVEALGDDWPQLRGPHADNISSAKNPAQHWAPDQNIAWKTAVPGRGRSSPVIVGQRIWLATALETNPREYKQQSDPVVGVDRVEIALVCLDRGTGKILYQVPLFKQDNPPPVHALNSYATPTPVYEGGLLYCDHGYYGTACVEAATGKILWTASLPIDHQLGPGSSPALWKDVLLVVRDGRDQQFVAGLDKKTGKILWKTPRPPVEANSPNMKKSFGTPLVAEAAGKPQALIIGPQWMCSYDPASGKELWRIKHGKGFSVAPIPVFAKDVVYFCTGCFGSQLWAARVDGEGDVTATHVLWKASGGIPWMPSPLLLDGRIYLVSDSGQATCFDSATGKPIRMQRLGGKFAASPVLADGKLFFFDQEGKATITTATPELEKLATNELEGPLIATPAILQDGIFLRTDRHLYCIREKSRGAPAASAR